MDCMVDRVKKTVNRILREKAWAGNDHKSIRANMLIHRSK